MYVVGTHLTAQILENIYFARCSKNLLYTYTSTYGSYFKALFGVRTV